MRDAALLAYRALVMYGVILVVTRILGKRELGQVSPFDFVVAIMLGELAVLTIENRSIPLWLGMVPIGVIVILHILIAYISMKSLLARRLLSGRPTQLISNGNVVEGNLKSLRFNINDLLGSLREQGVFDLAEVENAVMENTGKLSVQLKSQHRPLRPADIRLHTDYEGLSKPLIIDGTVQENYLREANLSPDWLRSELSKRGMSTDDVLLASLNTSGDLYVSLREPRSGKASREPRP